MALSDINFCQGEGQDFLVEIPTGILHAISDILVESQGSQFLVLERPQASSSIFIMSE